MKIWTNFFFIYCVLHFLCLFYRSALSYSVHQIYKYVTEKKSTAL